MIVAAARELAGQGVCFVGVGLPNIAVNLAQRTVAPDIELVYEAGVFGARPARLPLSIGDPTIVTGAIAATSMFELFAFYLRSRGVAGAFEPPLNMRAVLEVHCAYSGSPNMRESILTS